MDPMLGDMIGIRWRGLVLSLAVLVSCHPPSGPADLPRGDAAPDWRLVVQADYIVRGRADCAATDIESAKPGAMTLGVAVVELIRGEPRGALRVGYRLDDDPQHQSYEVNRHALARLCQRPVIAFVASVPETGELFFVPYAHAVQPDSPALVRWARQEVAQQESLAASVERSLRSAEQPEEVRVMALIERLRDPSSWDHEPPLDSQKSATFPQALAELEALGDRAIPAIVKHLDDRRSPGRGSVSFVNHYENAFEGLRHYGVEAMIDVLRALLNQLTGEFFADPKGWRIWLGHSGKFPPG
jgi:hypothetical protein